VESGIYNYVVIIEMLVFVELLMVLNLV